MQSSSIALAILGLATTLGAVRPRPVAPTTVNAELAEWRVTLSADTVPAGSVTFTVKNAGTMTHGFEVEGKGIEKRTKPISASASGTLTLNLKPGTYEVYCPVGGGAHKRMGMLTHLTVVAAK